MRSVCRIAVCVMVATAASAAIQTAGTLLVDIKASDVAGYGENGKVSSWLNNGSVGGTFVPVVSGEGARYQSNVSGAAAAVTFAASANSVMTNTVLAPSSILGTNPWSAEIWVLNPTLEAPEDQFSWTQRAGAGWGTDNPGSCMEIRYGSDPNNTVEHYGEPNIPWADGIPPQAGVWHHIAITRDAGGVERLYADGVLRTTKTPSPFNLRDNGAPFAIGGVWEGSWVMLFSGSLGQVRVHSGTLSGAGVLNNFMSERSAYGLTTPSYSVWAGTAGVALPWGDSANWAGGLVGTNDLPVTIANGGIAVLAHNAGTVSSFSPTDGGLVLNSGASLAVAAAGGTVSMGSGSGKSFNLTLAAGSFEVQGANALEIGASGGSGQLHLNGGQLRVNAISATADGASHLFYFNGGTLLPRASSGTFMQGLSAAYVQSGNAVFDVAGGVAVTVAQPLLTDPLSTGGGLKKYGTGSLSLGGTNTFTGNILIDAGDLWFTNDKGLDSYAGTITMTNASASAGYSKAGGVSNLLAHVPTSSVGRIMLFSGNANDTVDFSTYPGLTFALNGSFTYTGNYIPFNHQYVFAPQSASVYAPAIVNGSGIASVTLNAGPAGSLELTGDSSYTGGTVINSGMLVMAHTNALGAASSAITINSNAVLKLNVAGLPANFAQRITAGSKGQILLGPACADLSLDLTGRPGLIVGTDQGALTYSGTLTPNANTYHVGGGNVAFFFSGNEGLVLTNLSDAAGPTPRQVVVESRGLVRLAAGNTYSGGTVITNNGAVFLAEDGLGAAPASPDPDNIFVDNGVLRSAGVTFSLDANRGLTVGPGGLELHPWSTGIMAVPGDLSGSGRIFTTDSGAVIFGGANNTWTGRLDIGTSASIIVGTGPTFSWNRDVVISSIDTIGGNGQNGGYLGVNRDSDFTWSSAFANPLGHAGVNLGLRKLGTGTLTVDVAQPYVKDTSIEGGTLKVGSAGAVPSGAGKGNVYVAGGSRLDANGSNLSLNGLSGAGSVIDSNGGSTQLTVGLNDAGGTFSGAVDPDMLLVKTGGGTETLGSGASVNHVRVDQGTLGVVNPTTPAGTVTLTGSSILSVSGNGTDAASRFTALTAPAGTRIDVGGNGKAEVVLEADATIGSAITGTSPSALLIKSGAGKLSLTSAASAYTGQTRVDGGTLALLDAGALGPVEVAASAALTVNTALIGLPGAYYDFNQGDANYSMYNSQATLEAFLSAYTPNLISGSELAGATFDFGSTGSKFPGIFGTTHQFQAYWKGVIDIPTAGSYTFYTASDDGSMLFIDGATVVNNNYLQGVTERSGTVTLTAGLHAIAIAFYDHGGGWGLYVNIAGPGIAKQLIPNSMLHPLGTSNKIGALSGQGAASLLNAGAVLSINQQVGSTYAGGAVGPTNSGILKAGSQTLTLTGSNDAFFGAWFLTAGTLQVGDGGATGALGGTSVSIGSNAMLTFNRSDGASYAGEIRGSGAILIPPGQDFTLTGALSWSATVTNNGDFGLSGPACIANSARIFGTGTTRVQTGAKFTVPNPASFPNRVALEGGALLLASSSQALSNLTALAGEPSSLVPAYSTNTLGLAIDRLTLETGALLLVGDNPAFTGSAVPGLYGRYYNEFPSSGNAAFLTPEAFESYFAGRAPDLVASSALVGESFDFGATPSTLFPGLFQTETVFAAIWRGKIKIDVGGVYSFATQSDDNSMLFIDGATVVDNNGPHGFDYKAGNPVNLTAGLHDIVILFADSGGGYGLHVDITFPGQSSGQRLPNSMLYSWLPVMDVATVAVTNGPGAAALSLDNSYALRVKDFWFDTGARLSVTSAVEVAVAGDTLTVTVPEEVPVGSHLIADFTATPGLSLSGVTLTAVGTKGHLVYRDKRLYLVRSPGTRMIFR